MILQWRWWQPYTTIQQLYPSETYPCSSGNGHAIRGNGVSIRKQALHVWLALLACPGCIQGFGKVDTLIQTHYLNPTWFKAKRVSIHLLISAQTEIWIHRKIEHFKKKCTLVWGPTVCLKEKSYNDTLKTDLVAESGCTRSTYLLEMSASMVMKNCSRQKHDIWVDW